MDKKINAKMDQQIYFGDPLIHLGCFFTDIVSISSSRPLSSSSKKRRRQNGRSGKSRSSLGRRRNWLDFSSWRPADASRRRSSGGWRWRKSVHWSSSAERRS